MRRAFSLIELLVVVSVIALLIAILLPALGSARHSAKLTQCAGQFQQVGLANRMYIDEHKSVFTRHRSYFNITLPDGTVREEFWFDRLRTYFDNETGYRCPDIESGTFEWAYDDDNIGYGYNAWFLGQHPSRSDRTYFIWTAGIDLSEEAVLNPSQQLVFADSERRGGTRFSVSLWFPGAVAGNEAIANERHQNKAAVAFHDGHVEVFQDPDRTINPEFDGSDRHIEHWDPQQRAYP